jgi:hypothetical protein
MAIARYFMKYGADTELDSVDSWLLKGPYGASLVTSAPHFIADLRAARRPLPPVSKSEAIAVLNDAGLDSAHYAELINHLAELINHLQVRVSNEDREIPTVGYYSQSQQLLDRARAALARPEPQQEAE